MDHHAQLHAIIREGNDLYNCVLEDGRITQKEVKQLLNYLDRAATILEKKVYKKNPQPMCHFAYAKVLTFDRNLSDEEIWAQAKEDGFDPDLVLFLTKEMK